MCKQLRCSARMLLQVVFVFLLAMQIPVRFRYRIERRQARWNVVFPELSSANFTADSPAQARTEAPEKALTAPACCLRVLKPSPSAKGRMRVKAKPCCRFLRRERPALLNGRGRFRFKPPMLPAHWALRVRKPRDSLISRIPQKSMRSPKRSKCWGLSSICRSRCCPKVLRRCSMKSPGADEHQSQPRLPMMPRAPEADQPQRSSEAGESALSKVSRRFVFESFNKDIEIFINLDHTRRIVCGIVFNHPFADNVVDAAALGIPS